VPSRTTHWSGRPTAPTLWSFLALVAVGRRSAEALDAKGTKAKTAGQSLT
jgi:hypothetical protein